LRSQAIGKTPRDFGREDIDGPAGENRPSTMICVPTSLDQEVGECLGAQAGEAKLSGVIRDGGFTRVRRATECPFNMVLEARAQNHRRRYRRAR
jgi:hypothetical protein